MAEEPKFDELAFYKDSDSFAWVDARLCEVQVARKLLGSEDLTGASADLYQTIDRLLEESARLLTLAAGGKCHVVS
jgi:hypothetical protein